ncbi:transmembrane protease serine 3-like [Dendronephthya gigantea]|uniref:transmembrane protease serine 3-like n=1 Tax=Dendronephthya gigantea TaxID=151771 RepID=UPI00106992F9|nr:transmembrane protease serine 3-like [Dendronephthya gigantea]
MTSSSRIVGGSNALSGQWPWQVSVFYKGGHWCGGSIIDNEWIVSAAHCFHDDRNTANYKITVGDHDLRYSSRYEQVVPIERLIIHDDYDPNSQDNDIALLKLETPIKYNSRALPVCLPSSNLPAGTQCWVTGWGALEEDGHGPAILQQAKVPLVSKQDCGYVYGSLTSSMLCAGYHTGKIDSCQGDSGGPLVCSVNRRWHLMGAVSWGVGCARKGYYGVYADIVHFKSWITNVM